ncbi:P1 family peptidase [Gracilibacillus kekensis]|uniref:L-aminopeptidase/D-esterase n=1 Tax=Gracilibacillus kekensis TaxID=1027249 RepID=A0A1M7PMV0_9BACI|nr:P1 family peptidase [Gracilibacillus kekensis]SHN18635.1 L-aminopeptidase/D-esterase [Gracilibacillus kekensis]
MKKLFVDELQDFRIGHQQDTDALTGCTVIICEEGATTGVDVKGGAPGTRETDLLASENTVEKAHATFLSGGSAFGLDAGSGVMYFLEERDIGFDVVFAKVPIVPGAILFDLGVGSPSIRPDKMMGYQACVNAYENTSVFGNVGAGCGATVGKALGNDYSMKSGIGFAAYQLGSLQVAAVVAVNAIGDIVDPITNQTIAGLYDKTKRQFLSSEETLISQAEKKLLAQDRYSGNTTIGTIMTNANLTKAQTNKIASIAQDGIAKTITPSHTLIDGDTLFMMASGKVEADPNAIAIIATKVIQEAIIDGVKKATSVAGIPSYNDIF